jgi:outer membrane protein
VNTSVTLTGLGAVEVELELLPHPVASAAASRIRERDVDRDMDPLDLTWAAGWSKIMSFVTQKGLTGMKVFAVAVALSVTLAAAPSYAQGAAGQPRPAAPAGQTPPASPRPAAPATTAPATATPAPAQRPPFPTGVKYAFIYVQKIAAESTDGKAATGRIQALNDQKVKELSEKQKALQASQQKLEQGGSVLSAAAQQQLATDVEKQQREIQRFTEDADREVQTLQQQLQDDFQRKLSPIIGKIAADKQLHMIFSVTESGLVWGDPALDLTDDVIKALNEAPKK